MKYVFVQGPDGRALDPTTRYGKVRHMLKDGRASVVCRKPFTIRLNYSPATNYTHPMCGGTDPGRTNIGNAVLTKDGTVVYKDHVETANKNVPKHMSDRKAHRQASRRGERLARKRLAKKNGTVSSKLDSGRLIPGCDKPVEVKDIINTEARFMNRKRSPGWLTPTVRNLISTHLNHAAFIKSILPVTEWTLEANRFAFMKMEDGTVRGMDFQDGRMKGYKSVEDYVFAIQDGKCACCGEPIHDCHHIVPRHKNGSDGPENRIGLCDECHHKVHVGELDIDNVGHKQKYGALSVLNQAIPYIYLGLVEIFGEENVHLCQGYETKEYRESQGLVKWHTEDSECISAIGAEISSFVDTVSAYEVKQFRRHDRAIINNQRERSYKALERTDKGDKYSIVAKNRRPREEQKGDALSKWYEKAIEKFGKKEARCQLSQLCATKSTRYRNTKDRVMPGALFRFKNDVYVMTGQLCNGTYFRAYGHGKKNFPARQCEVIKHNCGLVYL